MCAQRVILADAVNDRYRSNSDHWQELTLNGSIAAAMELE